jgi:hypothetical protein
MVKEESCAARNGLVQVMCGDHAAAAAGGLTREHLHAVHASMCPSTV